MQNASKSDASSTPVITPEMTVLDVIAKYRSTETVFKSYDQQAGVCICCEALFDSLEDVAHKFGLNLEKLLSELEKAGA